MGQKDCNKDQIILQEYIEVEKIISYDAKSSFTYYYPRLRIIGKYKTLKLDGIDIEIDLLISVFNHLFEVLALTFEEFHEICNLYLVKEMSYKIKLKNLIYICFYEEYIHYLRPLLQLSITWVQVDAVYDKYYFISKDNECVFRIDLKQRIEIFKIICSDIFSIDLEYVKDKKGRKFKENIVLPVSNNLYSRLK